VLIPKLSPSASAGTYRSLPTAAYNRLRAAHSSDCRVRKTALAFSRPFVGSLSLSRLLRLARHHPDLLQHAHEIVKKILFYDLALIVPVRNGAEIYVVCYVTPEFLSGNVFVVV
jgi:hypothetical protein